MTLMGGDTCPAIEGRSLKRESEVQVYGKETHIKINHSTILGCFFFTFGVLALLYLE